MTLVQLTHGGVIFTVTQIVHMCTEPNGWGGLWSAINIVMKLSAATSASRMSATFSQLTGEEPLDLPSEDNFPVCALLHVACAQRCGTCRTPVDQDTDAQAFVTTPLLPQPHQGYQRPLASEDYQAMATEAANKHASVAESSTSYRSI